MLKQLHSVARPVKEEICHVLLTILKKKNYFIRYEVLNTLCLLYTSDAADE